MMLKLKHEPEPEPGQSHCSGSNQIPRLRAVPAGPSNFLSLVSANTVFLCDFFQCLAVIFLTPFHHVQVEESDLVFLNTSAHLGPDSRTCDLYDLRPDSTYYVKVS